MTRTNLEMYEKLGRWESGDKKDPKSKGSYSKVNGLGYLGKYQMGTLALIDAGYCTKGKGYAGVDGVSSKEDFLNNPKVQEKAVRKYHVEKWKQLKVAVKEQTGKNVKDFLGKTINGIPITPSGLLIASHLVGQAKVAMYLKSNGKPNSENKNGEDFFDDYGTHLEEYMAIFADYDVSETTKIPHKEWGFNAYLKNKGEDTFITDREVELYKNFGQMQVKNNEKNVKKATNNIDKLNKEINRRMHSAYDARLDEIEEYIQKKYENCKNSKKGELRVPHIKNMTFEEYKANKYYKGRKNTKSISANNEKPADNRTASNAGKQGGDDFVDYSHDPFLEAFMSDDIYERKKLIKMR